jgi:hypothetical protein
LPSVNPEPAPPNQAAKDFTASPKKIAFGRALPYHARGI